MGASSLICNERPLPEHATVFARAVTGFVTLVERNRLLVEEPL
jgi:hypothetical protein